MVSHVLDGRRRLRRDFPQFSPGEREQAVQQWARHMLQILGVELHVMGAVPKGGPLLLVSNHVSWLDILVINAVRPARFVSKADVRHWPLVGELITAAGTLYIEREKRRDAMRVVHRMADSLREGDVVAVFPEGTTGSGLDVLPFTPICCKRPFQPTHRSSRWHWSISTRLPGIRARHPCMWVTRPFWPRSGEP
jgi:1-acyl-sn-glycerol-3-phosphate acyltransferase